MHAHRRQLLDIYQAALKAVAGDRVVAEYLMRHPLEAEWAVLAIGKAAGAMLQGARQVLGDRLVEVLVIAKDPLRAARAGDICLQAGHPVPDQGSLDAGAALLDFLAQLPHERPLLVLLSGGASALVEVLPDYVSAEQWFAVNEYLLGSGLAIGQVNQVRKRLSELKGGRLIPRLRGRRCLQLLIADVPGDELSAIGSGPLIPDPLIDAPLPELPGWIAALCEVRREVATPITDVELIETRIIANNRLALNAAANAARALGLTVYLDTQPWQGELQALASRFCQQLRDGPAGVYLLGGEATIRLPAEPGRGGRNQQLALQLAEGVAGLGNILVLAAATDGSDGPGSDAGGLVDGGTRTRGEQEGFSIALCLARANAGAFLEASGDLISTGPTGSNVMDLLLGWKW